MFSQWDKMSRTLGVRYLHTMDRGYNGAVALLNSRRRRGRPKPAPLTDPEIIAKQKIMPTEPTLTGTPSLVGMKDWLRLLGHSENNLDRLNTIQIAGTKGKGSTCAFVNSFLQVHGKRTGFPNKVGLYTSPHLKCIRERIQINSKPISEELFAKYVFEIWDAVSSSASLNSNEPKKLPRYLQFLALLSFHVFIRERVDAAVIETHNGGEYDATNVFENPTVTGITTIGMDHILQLGPSIENIAWHKAGLFRSNAPAFSTLQVKEVATTLQLRAAEKGTSLNFVHLDSRLPVNAQALIPDVQRTNASLALVIAEAFLKRRAPQESRMLTSQDIDQGVEQFFWIGRFQQLVHGRHHWFIDGAHNELSVQKAAQWFAQTTLGLQTPNPKPTRILVFGHHSHRDGLALLTTLAKALKESGTRVQYALFCGYEEREDGTANLDNLARVGDNRISIENGKIYAEYWKTFEPGAETRVEPSIEGALKAAKKIGLQEGGMQTLITGSLYLVGGALCVLEPETPKP